MKVVDTQYSNPLHDFDIPSYENPLYVHGVDPPIYTLDDIPTLTEHCSIVNSSSLISNCKAEKSMSSNVSSVQAGRGVGLEAGRKSVSFKHDGPVAKLDRHEPDLIPGKVDMQLKKPPHNWAKKSLLKMVIR
ncbi:uncharacterized protein G2W53_041085 [Senna tora]|uniref:Uncharacterized protein n=1 Tax=Senna tora TaxID=362788 RepID=A0A834SRD5_9FABA|nr:uncharacterized protein G2W53_041085 [Senna tora]